MGTAQWYKGLTNSVLSPCLLSSLTPENLVIAVSGHPVTEKHLLCSVQQISPPVPSYVRVSGNCPMDSRHALSIRSVRIGIVIEPGLAPAGYFAKLIP
jgi:hypothetical protein